MTYLRNNDALAAVGKIIKYNADGSARSTANLPAAFGDGTSQSISALNYGKFVPGTWRVNPVILSKTTSHSTVGSYTLQAIPARGIYKETGYGNLAGVSFTHTALAPGSMGYPGNAWDVRLAALSLVQAYAKAKGASSFDGAVFLGELTETLKMLRSPMAGLVKLLTRPKFRSPKRIADASVNTYLEFRFGINPLASDLSRLMYLFKTGIGKADNSIRVARASNISSKMWRYDSQTSMSSSVLKWSNFGTQETRITSGIGYKINTGVSRNLHELGLGQADVLSTVWELVPFSFVVDWLYSVGPWIQALTPDPTITVLGNYTSCKIHGKVVRTSIGGTVVGGSESIAPNGSSLVSDVSYLERRCNSTLPALPVRRINLDQFCHVADSLSLLWQKLPRAWRHA